MPYFNKNQFPERSLFFKNELGRGLRHYLQLLDLQSLHKVISTFQRSYKTGGWAWRESGDVRSFHGCFCWLYSFGARERLAISSSVYGFASRDLHRCRHSCYGNKICILYILCRNYLLTSS